VSSVARNSGEFGYVSEKSRTHATADPDPGPNVWTFDLCNVTLANLKYRKMSLVRDYEALLDDLPENPAFEATFSSAPRAAENGHASPPPSAIATTSCRATHAGRAIAEAAGRP